MTFMDKVYTLRTEVRSDGKTCSPWGRAILELPLKFLQFLFQYSYPLINGICGQMDEHSDLIGGVPIHFQHRDLQGELVHCQQGFR